MPIDVIKIFIASPSGLEAERDAVARVIEEINKSHSEHWKCQFQLVGWEDITPSYIRAQERINQGLDKCIYFIGIVWDHWGSDPGHVSDQYSSGFQEEFERAKLHYSNGKMKDIALYFKSISEDKLRDPGESLTRVLKFKESCNKGKNLLYKEFKDISEFESMIRSQIESYGWMHFNDSNLPPGGAEGITDESMSSLGNLISSKGDKLFSQSVVTFINNMLNKSSNISDTKSFEVARMRLISCALHRAGNDVARVGIRDANILYRNRDTISLSSEEIQALIDTGISYFDNQNVPLWHWLVLDYKATDSFMRRPRELSVSSSTGTFVNSLRVLQGAGCAICDIDESYTKEKIVSNWFHENRSKTEIQSAFHFLATNGNDQDLNTLLKIQNSLNGDHKRYAREIIVLLSMNESCETAFERLVEFDIDPLQADTLKALFSNPTEILSETLIKCLDLSSAMIRGYAARVLLSRDAIDEVLARRLIFDGSRDVRFTGLEALSSMDKPPSPSEVCKILTPTRAHGKIRYVLDEDQLHYNKYKLNRLSELSLSDLKVAVRDAPPNSYIETLALNYTYTRENYDEICSQLSNGFQEYFENRVHEREQGSLVAGIISQFSLPLNLPDSNFVSRKKLTTGALVAICKLNDSTNIDLVRKTLDEFEVNFRESIVDYIGKFGNWSDISRLLKFGLEKPGKETYIGFGFIIRERASALSRAIYNIGKSRVIDIFSEVSDFSIKENLIRQMLKSDFLALPDNFIVSELRESNSDFRRALALRCVSLMTKSRLRKIMEEYVSSEDKERYYSSIHWLDLGLSMPQSVARKIAKFELCRDES